MLVKTPAETFAALLEPRKWQWPANEVLCSMKFDDNWVR